MDGPDVSRSYWQESRQPVYSAALILPFVVVYEVGIIFLQSNQINGGDAVMRTLFGRFFNLAGVNISHISVLVLVVFFLFWQARRKGSWRVESSVLLGSFFESLLYAALLFLLLYYLMQYLPHAAASTALAPCAGGVAHRSPALQDFVLYCGAGVYEELVFRVLLLGLLILVFTKFFHMEHAYAAAWAVVLGALIFSGFHHIGGKRFGGEEFSAARFLQRTFAGLYFATIYLNRSYGVAAASHAFYDILVGLSLLR